MEFIYAIINYLILKKRADKGKKVGWFNAIFTPITIIAIIIGVIIFGIKLTLFLIK